MSGFPYFDLPPPLTSPPPPEPVSLAELKAHLRVRHDAEDALIAGLGVAARRLVEHRLSRALVTSSRTLDLDQFPTSLGWGRAGATIDLPVPAASVTAITYTDATGQSRTLPPDSYGLQLGSPRRIAAAAGWPAGTWPASPVRITYTAGYGDPANVPEPLKLAIKMLVGHWYENREAAQEPTVGSGLAEVPIAVKSLLATEDWGRYS